MDASELGSARVREGLEGWRSANFPRLMADPRFCAALVRLRNCSGLRSGSQIETEFIDAASLLASLAVSKLAGRKSFEQLWAHETGKTWKALMEFPARVRNMGIEIKQLNRSPFFNPTVLVGNKVPEDNIPVMVRNFLELSDILFYLANAIEEVIHELPAGTSKYYWRGRGHSPWIDQLMHLVKRLTDHYCDKEVAELLNAAETVLHPNKRRNNKGFDAPMLADFRSRRKRKATKT